MATKTANVTARVEPEVKEQAEKIMTQLGIPTSVVINMLYKQIVIKKGIPFELTLTNTPIIREEMDNDTFNEMMKRGYEEAISDNSKPASEVFSILKQDI